MTLLFLLFCACAMAAGVRSLYFSGTDMHKYNGTMTVMARVTQNGSVLADCELAAFDASGELRGSAVSHPDDGGIIFLTIQGDTSGAELHFLVVHGSDGENRIITDANETLVFVVDQTLGSYTSPQAFSITTVLKGDANGDGEVNIADVGAVINAILNGDDFTLGDVNDDDEVNIADVGAIIDQILAL